MNKKIKNYIDTRFDRFAAWLTGHCPETLLVPAAAFIVGILAGLAAAALKWFINMMSRLAVDDVDPFHAHWSYIFLPVIGVVLAQAYQRYVIKKEIYNGVERFNSALAQGKPGIRFSMMYEPIIAAAFTLGFGGSAGSEGPIASSGAAIGSNVARGFRFSKESMTLLVACGAAAGIAGIFKAPIGGAFFALECMAVVANVPAVSAVMVASITAGLSAYMFSGFTPDIYFVEPPHMVFKWLPYAALFGIFAGIYSLYYKYIKLKTEQWLGLISNHWVKNIAAGLAIGLAIFIFPSFYGEGYGFVTQLLANKTSALTADSFLADERLRPLLIMGVLAGMMLLKGIAVGATTNGGGVAGDFAPALFAGALAGYFFASVINAIWPGELPASYFALFGMAAVMAATQRAPFMGIFLVVEMGSAYRLLLPITIAASIAYLTYSYFRPRIATLQTPAPDPSEADSIISRYQP